MTARAFLLRGLIAGLVAGFATFLVAFSVGEPHLDAATAFEEAGAAQAHDRDDVAADGHAHSHGDEGEGEEVSRGTQRGWGLLSGSLAISVAIGGILALVAAGTVGRIGRLLPGQSTALVTLLGFVAVALVPFLKYPATPPAVGSGGTIGDRTALHFGFVVVSVVAAGVATYAALKVRERVGTYGGTVAGAAGYLVAMVVAGQLFPTVNEIGDFPGDTLWFFRRASLLTLATMWGVIGVVLTGLVLRLHGAETTRAQRRALAASL